VQLNFQLNLEVINSAIASHDSCQSSRVGQHVTKQTQTDA